jgi:hypothetical protein
MTGLIYEFDDLEIAPGVSACGTAQLTCTRDASIKGNDGLYKLTDLSIGWASDKLTAIDDTHPLWSLIETALNQHRNAHITGEFEAIESEGSTPFRVYAARHLSPVVM